LIFYPNIISLFKFFGRNQIHFLYWYTRRNIFGDPMGDDFTFLALVVEIQICIRNE